MPDTIKLIWTCSPKDFLSEKVLVENAHYVIEFDNGVVTATMPASYFDRDDRIIDKIEECICSRLLVEQVLKHYPAELKGIEIQRLYENGTRSVTEVMRADHFNMQRGAFDTAYTDSKGIRHDPTAERIARQERLNILAPKYLLKGNKKSQIRALLDSYNAALRDPANELVYLYEILERIEKYLGGKKRMDSALEPFGMSAHMRERLECLANDMPLREGRHRGIQDILRPATVSELVEARDITLGYIVAYLEYLEAKKGT